MPGSAGFYNPAGPGPGGQAYIVSQPIAQNATWGPALTNRAASSLTNLLALVDSDPQTASGSLAGEDNSKHVAIAIVLVGVVALAAGLVNVKLAVGKG